MMKFLDTIFASILLIAIVLSAFVFKIHPIWVIVESAALAGFILQRFITANTEQMNEDVHWDIHWEFLHPTTERDLTKLTLAIVVLFIALLITFIALNTHLKPH